MKNIIIASSLALLIIGAPTVQAQTFVSEEAYRVYALELIAQLLEQIVQLEQELAAREAKEIENFESFLLPDEKYVVARYIIADPYDTSNIVNREDREYFDRFIALVPDEFDTVFNEYVVFDGSDLPIDAFVETIPPYRIDTWRLGLNKDMFDFQVDGDELNELFVHEFAHIQSYDTIPGIPAPRVSKCSEYFETFGCPDQNMYLHVFTETFWSDTDLAYAMEVREAKDPFDEIEAFYLRNKNEFVTEYAASAPEEDFAESFTAFVLQDRPSRNRVKDNKVRFFYEYDALLEVRDEIRRSL